MTSSMLRRQLKNLVQNYSEAEVKVREATSNDPWGPSSTQMADISDLTYNAVACSEIMTMLWKRLKDDRNWRHIHKSLTLLEYLLKTGDDRVLLKMKDNIYIVKALTEYRFVEKDGKDQGVNVREKAKVVLVLMEDDDKLKEEREFAVKTREKTSKSSAASSADTIKDPNYKPCYVPGAAGLPSLDNIPSVADLTASFAARKEERLRQEAEKKEVERRAKMSEDELKWEDAGKSSDFKVNAWGGEKAEEKEEEAEEVKPDPWGAPKEPKEATDPWGTPTKPNTKDTAASSDPWGAPTTAEEDSFTAPKADEDPFTSTKTEDPFAAPKDGPDPFSASKDDPFNAPKDSSDPFSAPKGKEDPFAAPVDKADPFSSSNNDPFNAPKDDPFNAPKDDPFGTPKDDPFNAPKDDPFNAPKDDPFNAPKDDPFNAPKDDPFNAPKDDPFTAAKEDPFNAPKDDPFSAPKDDPFGSPKDDPFTAPISTPPKEDPFAAPTSPKDDPFTAPAAPPKEDPFSAPAQDDPFAAPTTPPKDDPFSTVSKPPEDDPFAAPTTPPKEDPFSAPSKPAPDDPFAAPTSPPKEDPFVAPKEEAADPFSAPPVSSPPGGADTWGPPAISPATTGADPWGASSPPKEMKGGDPWGNGASASLPVDNSDPFGDTSKPDNDPWGAPASAPANTDDAWGSAAPPSDSSPSSDPFGDGASKSKDPWGATTNATNDATGKRTAQEELYRKTSSFLGSAGASLVDLDDLFSSNPKPAQRPVANALAAGARGPVVRSGASLPETSAPPSSHVAPSPTYRAANPSSETPFFQSFTTGASYSGFSSLQAAQAAAPPGSVGANPQIGLYMTPLCGGAGAVQAGQPAANPLADPRLFGAAGMNPTGFFGGNFQVGGVTPQGEGGGVSLQPQMLYGGGGGGGGVVDETVNKNNNPFLF